MMSSEHPTVFTNCLSPVVYQGQVHPEELLRRELNATHGPLDFDAALVECEEHERRMQAAGARVDRLGVNQDLPDGVFLQDTAYTLFDVKRQCWRAFGASMGPLSRKPEVLPVLAALAARGIDVEQFPEDIDGVIEYGDVFPPMQLGSDCVVFVGRREYDPRVPTRTDDAGAAWFRAHAEAAGYRVQEFEFRNTLHATSLGNAVGMCPKGDPLILIDGSRCSLSEFHAWGVKTPQLEQDLRRRFAWGLNTVRLNGSVLVQRGFDPVVDILLEYGFTHERIYQTPWTQLPKVDGSPSCRCLLKVRSI